MKILLVVLVSLLLIGCSYSTRFTAGKYSASHSVSAMKHHDL